MSAHDPLGTTAAHQTKVPSDPPGRRSRHINIDQTGISMSAKTAWAVLVAIVAGVLAFTAYTAKLSTKMDLAEHDVSSDAHHMVVDLDGDGEISDEKPRPVSEVVEDNHRAIKKLGAITAKVETNTKAVTEVRDLQHEQRAEDLAYRAVDRLPKNTPRKRVQQKFEDVKARAKANLKAKRDIRDGINLSDF